MSEEKRKAENQKTKISKLANVSFYLGILTWLVVVVGVISLFLLTLTDEIFRPDISKTTRHIISIIVRSWFLITFFMSVVATICGLISLIYVKFKRSILKGTAKPFVGFACGVSYFIIFSFLAYTFYVYMLPDLAIFQCREKLRNVHNAMIIYANDFDYKYPPKDKWCDLLIKHTHIGKREFVCTGSKARIGESSFAINENAITLPLMNTPRGIVFLFECKPGWNQFGGPELLTFDNHGGEHCNILFSGGYVLSIQPKDVNDLQWKPDEAQEE